MDHKPGPVQQHQEAERADGAHCARSIGLRTTSTHGADAAACSGERLFTARRLQMRRGMANARFDAQALISEFGDEGLIADLAQLLLDHAEEQLQAVHAAVASGNAAGLKSAAHKIKGGMGTFGAAPVTALAVQLEALGRDGRMEGTKELAEQLDGEVRALCEGARVWLAGRAA